MLHVRDLALNDERQPKTQEVLHCSADHRVDDQLIALVAYLSCWRVANTHIQG